MKRPDGSTFLYNANRNNIAIVEFQSDSGDPADTHIFPISGKDIDDTYIADQAFYIIKTLNEQEAALADITVAKDLSPAQLPVSTKSRDLALAFAAVQEATLAFQVAQFSGPLAADAKEVVAAQEAFANYKAVKDA